MTAALVFVNSFPDLATLHLILNQSDDRTTLQLQLQVCPQWLPLGAGRVHWALRGSGLHLTLPHLPASESMTSEFGPVEISGDRTLHWSLTFPPQAHHLDQTLLTLPHPPQDLQLDLVPRLADCAVLATEGLWTRDLSPNQQAIAKRAIVKALWSALPPFLCRITTDSPPASPAQFPTTIPTLETILTTSTAGILDLAQLAQLDPAVDFAGGDFLGVDLQEADLSGADLRGVNLRGADLSDADLSGANLSGANLSGADLSGAFLENANLSGANLQRASLALVSLAGVNLSQANLCGATVSETVWTGATLTQMTLGDNLGLTPTAQQQLIERGAIAP
ncbi:pentapeptide repeat-containing protein [Spirulina major]|uniref:pentapeptide repeat-containing protein n=1 Tax=Spirulina major TaxID=270636 RepID=UPI000933071B|nr:pentapeptide repeat-containing protein [Spirulina major]